MKSLQKTLILVLCLVVLGEIMHAQEVGFFRTRQSGDWNDNIWEQYNGTVWVYPTYVPNAITSDGILIVRGHEITVSYENLVVDQLRVEGTLTVRPGSKLTVADGTGTDILVDHPDALLRIQGRLINNGQIKINQGGLQIGTVENNGDIEVGGILEFVQGTVTGNDIRFGPIGSLVINSSWYNITEENHFWPTTNGPASIYIQNNAIISGNRIINGTLDIAETLLVKGTLTNTGTVNVSGTLEVEGTYNNDGTTEISGKFLINPTGNVSGNGFVYTGCCSLLEFSGTNFTYNINNGNAFWPGTNEPKNVMVTNNLQVNVNATRATDELYVNFYATLQVTGTLTTHDSSTIRGIFLVPGTYVNNDKVLIGRIFNVDGSFVNNGIAELNSVCEVTGSMINNGTAQVNNIFQFNQGGTVSGNDLIYGPYGVLIFNNALSSYQVNSESPYWPNTNAAPRIVVQGAGGITLNTPHTVTGLLQVEAAVTGANNLLISGTLQMESGGFLDASPVYSGEATLVYNSVDSFYVGSEWVSGTDVGAGIPKHIEVNGILVMPDSPRRCPGNLTIYGELFMNTALGADLSVGGNWHNDGLLFPNFKQVIFNGTTRQTLSGVTTFDFLTIDNPDGVWQEGNCWFCPQLIVGIELNFLSGKLFLGDENCPSILSILGQVKGVSNTSYIVTFQNSYVERYIDGSNSFQFPIGASETSYNPITVELPIQVAGIFRASVDSTMLFQNVDSSYCVQRTWFFLNEAECNVPGKLTVDGDSTFFKLTFQWNANDEGVNFTRNVSSTYDGINEYKNEPATGADPYTVMTIDSILYQPLGQAFIISNAGGLTNTEDLSGGEEPLLLLEQNFPNPVDGSTTIRYTIPESGHVRLSVYDALGREVKQLVNALQPGGTHDAIWNAEGLANGVYFYRLQIGAFVAVKMMTVLK